MTFLSLGPGMQNSLSMFFFKEECIYFCVCNLHVHDNEHTSAFIFIVRDSIDEPRRSKRCRFKISFGHDFLTNFLIEDFDVTFLSDELESTFFIEEEPKTYGETMT